MTDASVVYSIPMRQDAVSRPVPPVCDKSLHAKVLDVSCGKKPDVSSLRSKEMIYHRTSLVRLDADRGQETDGHLSQSAVLSS